MYQFFHNAAAYLQRRGVKASKANAYHVQASDGPTGEHLFASGLDVRIVNNISWLQPVKLIDFLSNVGRYARVNDMLARDSVKNRLTTPGEEANSAPGLSFTEFSYQLMQAYDFSILHQKPYDCSVQIGGSDQMGNISAGIDLIRRQKAAKGDDIREDPAYGLTLPLLTTANGSKFGKSAGNAVWISPGLLSDMDFYQYFLRSSDADVERFLRCLTLMPTEHVTQVLEEHNQDRSKRVAQKALAAEMIELVRGEKALQRARVATKVLFGTRLEELQVNEVLFAFENDPRLIHLDRQVLGSEVLGLVVHTGLASSKSSYWISHRRCSSTSKGGRPLLKRFTRERCAQHNRRVGPTRSQLCCASRRQAQSQDFGSVVNVSFTYYNKKEEQVNNLRGYRLVV